jgi:hypothetical protein
MTQASILQHIGLTAIFGSPGHHNGGTPMKKISLIICVLLMAGTAFGASQFYSSTELSYHDPDKAFQGYNLFHPLGGEQTTFLIDMNGEIVNRWPMDADKFVVSNSVHLYEDGLLLRTQTPQYVGRFRLTSSQGNPLLGSQYQFLDWDSNVVAEVRHPDHKDPTEAELQAIFGLTDAQMLDQTAIDAAVAGMTDDQEHQIHLLTNYREHHDARRVWNESLGKYTIMFIANKKVPEAEVLNAGQDPALVNVARVPSWPDYIDSDVIAEVDIETGELIWEWWTWEHIIQNYGASADNYAQDIADANYGGDLAEAFYRRLDVNHKNNQGAYGIVEDWFHINSFDFNPIRDEVVLNSRSFSEFYLVDHSKTTAELQGSDGDFLFRWGSPSNYASEDQLGAGAPGVVAYPSQNDPSFDQMYGSHDIQWIREGLPGAGNFLIFDNGIFRPTYQNSAILEIDPYDANGDYVRELDAGYKPTAMLYPGALGSATFIYGVAFPGNTVYIRPSNQLTWAFTGNSWNFFGPHISGCQRMPNGNTVVCDGPNGHFFEVTVEGEVVWEYTNPSFGLTFGIPGTKLFGNQIPGQPIGMTTTVGLTEDGETIIGGTGGAFQTNDVFRVYRYGLDYPAFSGKDMSPKGTLTGRIPGRADAYPEPPAAPTGWGTSGLSAGEGGGGSAGGASGAGGTGY